MQSPFEARTFGVDGGRPAPWVRLARSILESELAAVDVRLDGSRPWDPRIVNERAILRMITQGTLGAGESYVAGDWECAALDELVTHIMSAHADRGFARSVTERLGVLFARVRNRQSRARGGANVVAHYDRGNDLYEAMLGRTMAYSCGYWRDATTLDEAQDAKHELVCQKLGLRPGMRVLDIGCGWGAFARHAAANHGVEVVGVTLSPAQVELGTRRCAGLPVTLELRDYRALSGRFDRVVSIGMFEHVGPKNYRTFFETVRRVLAPDGLALLHTIGSLDTELMTDTWIDRYIFPNAVLPSAAQITAALEGQFVIEDWHNFGADYDRTLMAWHARFESAWPELRAAYDERFHRMWRYYLLTCAGASRARRNQLWQLVLSPRGVPGGYRRVGC